jgi:adenylate cyclase
VHGTGEALPLPDKPSIAVLAFTDMSGDPQQEYFSDGIADDIITELSRARLLFVIARNSSFAYKGNAIDVKQIGRELGVRYVLEGSVRRGGERVRVNAQLIDAEAGNHIWAERYDRALEDVFAVQDEITNAVAYAIEPAISHAERQRAIRKTPENLNAWEAYQRGLWHMAKRTQVEMERAQHFFRRAVELDPLFATPHAMLAFTYEFALSHVEAFRMNHELAKAEARKAIELDPDDASALAVMAWIPVAYGDYDTALQLADHAISINPNGVGAYVARAHALALGGRPAEAQEPLLTALRLSPRDPLRWLALYTLTYAHYLSGNCAEAAKVGQSVVRDFPDYSLPYLWLAASLGQLRRANEARDALNRAMTISPESFEFRVRQRQPWLRPEDYEHMLDGLRKAGWQG